MRVFTFWGHSCPISVVRVSIVAGFDLFGGTAVRFSVVRVSIVGFDLFGGIAVRFSVVMSIAGFDTLVVAK